MPKLSAAFIGMSASLALLVACTTMPDAKLPIVIPPVATAPCPDYPRCVSTTAERPDQRMAPLRYSGSAETAQQRLVQIISGMPRATITTNIPGYLAAEFKSRLVGFTDDVEFLFDPEEPIIHFRSGARVGYYDFGVNRSRMEAIIQAFQRPDMS